MWLLQLTFRLRPCAYLMSCTGWLTVDLLGTFPFELFVGDKSKGFKVLLAIRSFPMSFSVKVKGSAFDWQRAARD